MANEQLDSQFKYLEKTGHPMSIEHALMADIYEKLVEQTNKLQVSNLLAIANLDLVPMEVRQQAANQAMTMMGMNQSYIQAQQSADRLADDIIR